MSDHAGDSDTKSKLGEKWKPVREWTALGASLLALSISATTSYVTVLNRTEILEALAIDTVGLPQIGNTFYPRGPIRLLFVNRGNLPIAVSAADILFSACSGFDDERCVGREGFEAERALQMSPFVISPGEIVIKNVAIDQTPFVLKEKKLEKEEYAAVYGTLLAYIVTTDGMTTGFGTLGEWAVVTASLSDDERTALEERPDDLPSGIPHGLWKLVDRSWFYFSSD